MRTIIRITVVAVLALSVSACSSSDETVGSPDVGWTRVTAQELDGMMESGDVYLVNVHVPYEGEIPGTDGFVPYTEVDEIARQIEGTEGEFVLYCRSGNMSTQTAQALVDRGVTAFAELEGGYQAWQSAGLPFEVK